MDGIIRDFNKRLKSLCTEYRNLERVCDSECAFTDDILIIARSEEAVIGNFNVWNELIDVSKI